MSYLYSQLWLCLFVASLLGGLIGWFLRGDNRSKLNEIEGRWRSRFSELEYSNQALMSRLKQSGNRTLETKYKNIQTRLERMNKAAELSSQQLSMRKTEISKMEQQLESSDTKLIDKESQITELSLELSDMEARHKNLDKRIENKKSSGFKTPKMKVTKKNTDKDRDITDLTLKLEEKAANYKTLKMDYEKLAKRNDEYKASLIDAESKIQVTTEMLNAQSGD
jgi:chromosome segregation ATPase